MTPRKTPFTLPTWLVEDRPLASNTDMTNEVVSAISLTLSTGKAVKFTCDDPKGARALMARLRYHDKRRVWGAATLRTMRRGPGLYVWLTRETAHQARKLKRQLAAEGKGTAPVIVAPVPPESADFGTPETLDVGIGAPLAFADENGIPFGPDPSRDDNRY